MLTNRKTFCVCASLTAALLALFTKTPSIIALLSVSQLQKDSKEKKKHSNNIHKSLLNEMLTNIN